MSSFKVEVCKIEEVKAHPNADRLDLVRVKDWWCVSSKGSFNQGDLCVYFPIDSVLPPNVEGAIFGPDSKVKLHNSRIRTIKLRGAISQGLVVQRNVVDLDESSPEGDDVTKYLGVTKYEPPIRLGDASNSQSATKKQINPNFRKFGGIENAKNYPNLFEENEEVSVTEKCHGSHFRCGYVPFWANTWWKKLQKFFGFAPKYEFVFGSNNVQLQNRLIYKGYYDKNVYAEAIVKYNLKELLKPGEVLHGEVYGDGIQKNYLYDCKQDERKTIFFDVRINDEWLDTVAFRHWAKERGLPVVPELYRGPFKKEKIIQLKDGPSIICSNQKVREGIVVKPLKEQSCYIGRKLLKFISDEYLLKNQDEELEG